jgi:2-amino-4-hydroxy-6-hydroxymethyldihydropteridine diphosphokinase
MTYKYYLGLGSNIEPKLEFLKSAVKKLNALGHVVQKSSVYVTEPWGIKNQSQFYNAVVELHTQLTPQTLLTHIKSIEKEIGRSSTFQWGPREIDIDILFSNFFHIQEPTLQIPHKQFPNRRFVLVPMAEVNGKFMVINEKKTITEYLMVCQDTSQVTRLNLAW